MTAWAAKRFWKTAVAEACDGGFSVRLDARGVRTPTKVPMVLPSFALAEAVAAEWQAQSGRVNPETMPFTRTANSAIDKVALQFNAVVDSLAAYGGSDLLCYRATEPEALIARQAAGWDPVLHWAADALGAPLTVTQGVMPVAQQKASLQSLRTLVAGHTPFHLAAFHDLVAISGSLVLALAVTQRKLAAETAFDLSQIDAHWQAEIWGADEDATAHEALRKAAFLQADRFFGLCG